MSFHVLHLLSHGCRIFKDRGMLRCESIDGFTKAIAIEDLRAIIVAARGVQFTGNVILSLLENDVIILHCDSKYRPIGWTTPMSRTIDSLLFNRQMSLTETQRRRIWQLIVWQKVQNQHRVLKSLGVKSVSFESVARRDLPNEATAARSYWRAYFQHHGEERQRRSDRHTGQLNGMLNYGYAVLAALAHRAISIHGLMPGLGIHHKYRYRAHPLVYDLMEPLRPFVDDQLAQFLLKNSIEKNASSSFTGPDMRKEESEIFGQWSRYIGFNLKDYRVKHSRYSLKLMDAIDVYIRSFAKAIRNRSVSELWIPSLNE